MACGLAGELASRRDRRSPAAAGVLPVGLAHYPQWRDFPDRPGTTRLSPYLHFGEISARHAVWTLQDYSQRAEGPGLLQATEALIRQLGWREFAHHVLHHFPHTSDSLESERRITAGLAARPYWHSHRRCRHAPAVANWLDA